MYIPIDVSAGSNSLGAQRKYFWIRSYGAARIYSRRLVTLPAAVTCPSLANRRARLRGLSQWPRAPGISTRARTHTHTHIRARARARSLSCSLPQSPARSDPRRRSPWRRRPTPAFLGRLVSPVVAMDGGGGVVRKCSIKALAWRTGRQ